MPIGNSLRVLDAGLAQLVAHVADSEMEAHCHCGGEIRRCRIPVKLDIQPGIEPAIDDYCECSVCSKRYTLEEVAALAGVHVE
jgi:hypothetical protein